MITLMMMIDDDKNHILPEWPWSGTMRVTMTNENDDEYDQSIICDYNINTCFAYLRQNEGWNEQEGLLSLCPVETP